MFKVKEVRTSGKTLFFIEELGKYFREDSTKWNGEEGEIFEVDEFGITLENSKSFRYSEVYDWDVENDQGEFIGIEILGEV